MSTPRGTHFAGVVGGEISARARSILLLIESGVHDNQHTEAHVAGCPGRPLRAVLTGGIDNAPELIRELMAQGHRLKTATDTEIIAHAYEQWGVECVERLWGPFAFAVWDEATHTLLLARDRSGSRSVYYRDVGEGLAFGTRPSDLFGLADAPRAVEPQAIDAFLTLAAVPAPLSIYRGVKKLPAAHVLTFQRGTMRVRPYWSISFDHRKRLGVTEAVERCEALLRDVVARSAEGRPGVMLSGGLDSCIILALLSRVSPAPVPAFTFEFPQRSPDTKNVSRIVGRYGAEPHVFRITPRVREALPMVVDWLQQPYANPSALAMHCMTSALRGQTETVLCGEGADEVFYGRDRHLASAMAGRFQRLPGRRLAAAIGERLAVGRASLLLRGVALPSVDRYLLWTAVFPPAPKDELYTREFLHQIEPNYMHAVLDHLFRDATDPLEQALAADVGLWIPEVLWTNLAPGSGGADIEIRAPFLDHRIVEFSASLPPALRVGWITPKALLRRAFAGRIPLRPPRLPGGRPKIPLARVLRGELRGELLETLLSERALARGYFRRAAVRRIVSEHLANRANHSRQLWALLMLEQWHRRWLDR